MWARTFRALGVEKGDFIPLYVPASPESYSMFLAANAIGAIPYYQKLAITKEALNEETKGAKIAVVFDAMWNNVSDVFKQDRFKNIIVTSAADSMMFPLKQITKIGSYFKNKKENINIPNTSKYIWVDDAKNIAKYYTGKYKVPFSSNSVAVVTTSSGTTSHAVKGVMDTNEGVVSSLTAYISAHPEYHEGQRTLTCFPPTASTSLNTLQLAPTLTGGTIIFDPRVDTSLWYEQVMYNRPNITVSTGPVWEKFVRDLELQEGQAIKDDLSWADLFILGGSGTTPEILDYINSVIEKHGGKSLEVGYGFSEVFGPLSLTKGDIKSKDDSLVINVGLPLPGYKVGIFDENGNELPYGKGNRGELWVKSDSNMHGYYNKEEITKQTTIDGWIHSGDLCEIDNEGNIYYHGRMKNNVDISNNKMYLFDISNDIRDKFKLHDIFVEKKQLDSKESVLNMYFVQEESNIEDSKDLIQRMDNYLATMDIKINGYKEFNGFLPIDPTTLKPRNKDTEGFIKYRNGEMYEVSYDEIKLDTYIEHSQKVSDKILVK